MTRTIAERDIVVAAHFGVCLCIHKNRNDVGELCVTRVIAVHNTDRHVHMHTIVYTFSVLKSRAHTQLDIDVRFLPEHWWQYKLNLRSLSLMISWYATDLFWLTDEPSMLDAQSWTGQNVILVTFSCSWSPDIWWVSNILLTMWVCEVI